MTVEKLINFVRSSAIGTQYRIISDSHEFIGNISEFNSTNRYSKTHVKKSRWILDNNNWVFNITIF